MSREVLLLNWQSGEENQGVFVQCEFEVEWNYDLVLVDFLH